MGRGNSQKKAPVFAKDHTGPQEAWKRERRTRYQAPPPTLPNVDVYGVLFAVVAVVFVVYPLAQLAFSLGEQ